MTSLLKLLTGGLSFLKGLSLRTWIDLAVTFALLIAITLWNAHERGIGRAQDAAQIEALAKRLKTSVDDLAAAQAANGAFDGIVAGLKLSLSGCELGRTADAQAAIDAQKGYALQVKALGADAAKARAATAALLAGRCKSTADQAFCGVVP